jgi:hypothetical protein
VSDQLRIASALRKLDNASLEKLITLRMVNSTHLSDFFDFADALSTSKSVSAAISSLSARLFYQLEEICLAPAKKADPILSDLLLVEKIGAEFVAFDGTIAAVKQIRQDRPLLLAQDSLHPLSSPLDEESVDRDASLAIFDIIQALTELIFELEQRYIREVGKRGVGLPDVKRLANHLRKSNEYAKQVFELAQQSELAAVEGGRWQLGAFTENWIAWTDRERWQHLATTWLKLLGEDAANELLAVKVGENFERQLFEIFPFADSTVSNRIKKVAELAAAIGLVAEGQATSWLAALSDRTGAKASKLAVAGLPEPDERIIVQADLTLIAPSPLATDVEIRLRRFVDTEQVGMASSYRLSALSVSHGLETGLTIGEIRELLERLSGKALPQPVDYLLREAETRFARLRVKPIKSGAHSMIESADSILLAEIHNDQRLKPFALHFDEQGNLHSRFECELVYFALREANFVAVRVDEKGQVISPQKLTAKTSVSSQKKSVLEDIERMRSADTKGTSNPDDDDLLRQIQLAIKNKAKISITLKTAAGEEVQYLVEPVGVANGRLRAKDRKADIERTLPLSSLVSIEIQ